MGPRIPDTDYRHQWGSLRGISHRVLHRNHPRARANTPMNHARRIAILVADGIDVTGAQGIHAALVSEGAEPYFLGPRSGVVRGGNGADLEVQDSLDSSAA